MIEVAGSNTGAAAVAASEVAALVRGLVAAVGAAAKGQQAGRPAAATPVALLEQSGAPGSPGECKRAVPLADLRSRQVLAAWAPC